MLEPMLIADDEAELDAADVVVGVVVDGLAPFVPEPGSTDVCI